MDKTEAARGLTKTAFSPGQTNGWVFKRSGHWPNKRRSLAIWTYWANTPL